MSYIKDNTLTSKENVTNSILPKIRKLPYVSIKSQRSASTFDIEKFPQRLIRNEYYLEGRYYIKTYRELAKIVDMKKLRNKSTKQNLTGLITKNNSLYKEYDDHVIDSVNYISPFQGMYKMVNKRIIWKPPPQVLLKSKPKISRLEFLAINQEVDHKELPIVNKISIKKKLLNKPDKYVYDLKYAYGSKTGQKKILIKRNNQDSVIACSDFCHKNKTYFFSVADGHGVFGDKISSLVINSLKSSHSIQLQAIQKNYYQN